MADLKISELGSLAGGDLVAGDELAIVDGSASETKKIGVGDLIENGVTLISDDAIPGAKILFAAGDIVTADLADDAVTTAKVADNAITAAHLADESTVDLVTTLPASGAFTGQIALDTDDNKIYVWDGSAWQNPKAAGSVNAVDGSTTGIVNIVSTVSAGTATISATIDDTTAAAQFLAGPVASSGAVGYRAIDGGDLPAATTTSKGAVIVNGSGLQMNGDVVEVANSVTASSVRHLVTYDANGLITGGAAIAAGDLPIATTSTVGGVIVGDGLAVNGAGNLSVDNTVTAGEYTKVTVTERGLVSSGGTLDADDIPDHSAAKITSGTLGTSRIAADAITAAKLADQSTTKFGGAVGSDNVTIFPTGDFKGQFFYDETTQDLYIYTGSAFVPITVLSGNLVNAGAYNASTNQMSSVTSAGSSAGFSVGNALPAPAKTNLNHYVVVDTSGTGTGAAPAVALAPPDMLLSQGVGTEYSLIDVSNAIAGQTASNISLIATGDVIATDVQAAITELDQEKLPKAGGTMTGDLELNNADIVFEGSTADDYETTLTVTDPTADRTITLPNVTGTVVTTGDTGSVTSTMILDGTIANADISSSAEIAVSKLANGTARQLLQTNAGGTAPEFTSNIDVPGTLDVTGAATLDSTLTVTGLISADGKVSFPAGTAAAPSLYSGSDTDTGIYSLGSNQFGITTNGTAALIVDASQQVGIGTTSPSQKLTVAGGHVLIDSNNQLRFGTSDAAIIEASGSDGSGGTRYMRFLVNDEKMRIDSSGRLLVGTSSARTDFLNASFSAHLQVEGTSHDDSSISIVRDSNNSNCGYFNIGKSRGTSLGGDTLVQQDDQLGVISFQGADGSELVEAAHIYTAVDGTPGANDMPGRLVFSTTADGASSSTERLRIDSSGRVGVETTTVRDKVHIYGDGQTTANISDSGTRDCFLRLSQSGSAAGTGGGILFANQQGDDANSVGFAAIKGLLADGSNNTSGSLAFSVRNQSSATSLQEAMQIDTAGRLLIGTSSALKTCFNSVQSNLNVADSALPQIFGCYAANQYGARLDLIKSRSDTINGQTIVQANDGLGEIYFGGSDGTNVIPGARIAAEVDGTPGTNDMPTMLVFSTTADGASSPTAQMAIKSSGRVGIGTTSPAQKLEVKGTDFVAAQISGDSTSETQLRFASNTAARISNQANTALILDTNASEKMRIDSSGRVGIGITSPQYPLDVNGNIRFGANTGYALIQYGTDSTATNNWHVGSEGDGTFRFYNGNLGAGTEHFRIASNGDLTATDTTIGSNSDSRLKTNVADFTYDLEDFKQYQPKTFDWKNPELHGNKTGQRGFIAQDVEAIDSYWVSEQAVDEDSADAEFLDADRLAKTLKLGKKDAMYVSVIQQLLVKVETLEAKVAALEAG